MKFGFTQIIPLKLWEDGSIRVKETDFLVDTIINAHKCGEKAEKIFDSLPPNVCTLAEVYVIISYYLKNKVEFDKYLAECEKTPINN